MSDRVLVAYASRLGAAREVAETVGEVLAHHGVEADVRAVAAVDDLSGYTGVVIGAAVRKGALLPEALAFARDHREALENLPVACFVVCLTLKDNTKENRDRIAEIARPLCEPVKTVDVGLFAGRMDPAGLPWILRVAWKFFRLPTGDFRDWEAIRSWAGGLPGALRGEKDT